jgi:ZIP family zinc transporter
VTPQATGFLLSVAAASAAMLGWAAVAAKRTWTDRSVGFALLFSAAAMLTISLLELLPPGLRDPSQRQATLLLFAVGFLAVPALRWVLARMLPSLGTAQGAALLVMLAIALHNVPEGAVPFAAATFSLRAGLIAALAIGLHNIPEGMAVSSAVLATGGTRRRAFAYTGVSVLGEVAGAVLILAVGRTLSPTGAAVLLAFVAGIMVSVCLTQLIPAGVGLVSGAATERVTLAAAHSQG